MAQLRFGEFQREVTLRQQRVSYNELTPKPEQAPDGSIVPWQPDRLRLRRIDVYRLLSPYVSARFRAQAKAVVPLAAYLALFQVVVLRQPLSDEMVIIGGLLGVIVGLMLFMEGLSLGLMPFAEAIGNRLPQRQRLAVVLVIAFLLGIVATFAEPAIDALQAAGAIIDPARAPYLYALLNRWTDTLVLVVGTGVGLATVLGTVRFIYGWRLKRLIYAVLTPTLALTVYFMSDPHLAHILSLAWDCGAATTGPISVPLVLALGIGITAAAGKSESSLSGFGIVTLASLIPVLAVLLLGFYVDMVWSPAVVAAAMAHTVSHRPSSWIDHAPVAEIIDGIRSIVPLVLFLFLVLRGLLRERIPQGGIVAYGIGLALFGMIIFNLGLTYGLSLLGSQSGSLVAAAFMPIAGVARSPLYPYLLGLVIALLFAWCLGFGATLAEPALNALGLTVESLTNGAFRKQLLMYAVSTGVAFGLALGVAKITFSLPLGWLLLPLYLVALVLTALSSEEFVNIAWDSAGVTTGPVTVPLVLAMGLGFGNAVHVTEGFGILSMASICPVVAVLGLGLYLKLTAGRRARRAIAAEAA